MDKLAYIRARGERSRDGTDRWRPHLLERTLRVFDAVGRGGNGRRNFAWRSSEDVLLQVLFHRAASAEERATATVSHRTMVADSLVRKGSAKPGWGPPVLAGDSISLDEQLRAWAERKALEEV